MEQKLVLDFTYLSSSYNTRRGIAILDPATERWDVLGCSDSDLNPMLQINLYHPSALWRGDLFTSVGGQIKKYVFRTKQWRILPISDGGDYALFVVNDHLYAANWLNVLEIIEDGGGTSLLASTRRQPPMSVLDTQDFRIPSLFEGPSHSLRIAARNKIFTWTGKDWREDFAGLPNPAEAQICMDGVLFRNGYAGSVQPDSLSILVTEQNLPEIRFGQLPQPVNPKSTNSARPGANTGLSPDVSWKMPPELFLANLPATMNRSNLYFLVDHSEAHKTVDENQLVRVQIVGKEGYDATLLCFSPDQPSPQKIFLKFDSSTGSPPLTGINPGAHPTFPKLPQNWMLFTTNLLFLSSGGGPKPGVWLMPVSQIEAALAPQKQAQRNKQAQASAAAEQIRKNLLAKYDHNHNGVIDPEEKEEALDDPAFIESELDVIDANHNGWLDAEELAYFDANRNKILEPKEQAGIDIAQYLFAQRLLKKFDANGDGVLDRSEFGELVQACFGAGNGTRPDLSFQAADANHDGHIDESELEALLKQQTRRGLRLAGATGAAALNQMRPNANQPVDPKLVFKLTVESYWRNPGGVTNKPTKGATP
jgi:Ca2+-binding EF-hand superfamily protein